MARRSDHSREELKELALKSAEELLNEKSASELSTRQIATKMGYTVGTLYQIFDNLPDLLLHVNARTLGILYQDCQKLDLSAKDAQNNILAYANLYLQFAHSHPGLWELIFDNNVLNDRELPDWYLNQANALFSLIERQLKAITPDKSQLEITKTSRVLWSSVHGICTLSINNNLFANSACSSEELIESLVKHFIKGWAI
ncbi:MAG: TetR/AcrR family transcriptional regulator [gamma proteobacterium symbiont of Bathyaustriella thionipta]|nr:TetR/AcrR family transcriptional regulator [gamma proteobacterium symbiont of Bathyaustriella thionipta]MCU7951267.1 TetR/AcrR family transcriptional regulator [gamma proteobacterium symbiont of Bathyaustriella thionipta]MCU7953519.1 TetR/AcrR family transcriptional regulator [gamma proteobacterium symbiont of Bathyaustriella thionipta]MCU7957800.1 TetR/AcrR family transcriptional regulator [gamma proteobacterium symbiont of Bathyaustriella thionipta]MCU7967303.1 TetR/AcrR family transcripti